MPTEIQYAWLAGMIDGDGCLKAGINQGANKKGRTLHLEIGQVDKRVTDYILEVFGGRVDTVRTQISDRTFYRWNGGSTWLREHLVHVLPYLVGKQLQAEIVLELLTLKSQSTTWKRFEPERQDELFEALTAEKRGV